MSRLPLTDTQRAQAAAREQAEMAAADARAALIQQIGARWDALGWSLPQRENWLERRGGTMLAQYTRPQLEAALEALNTLEGSV